MQAKQAQFKTIGMNQDLSESAFNTQFAFENRNVRLTAIEGNTLMSMTNERGTLESIQINGVPLGYAVIDSKIVIFSVNVIGIVPECFIYLVTIDGEQASSELMYNGNLGFSLQHPIETLPIYENQNAIKVYWTDGINQPRVINIASYLADKSCFSSRGESQFDFVPSLALREVGNVSSHSDVSGGLFAPGTIQYVCTYYSKYGGESNIFYASPLLYIAHTDRGASPEDSVSRVFKISISNLDEKFDLVRLYSIHRTSQDAVPTVKRVADVEIQNTVTQTTSQAIVSNTNHSSGVEMVELVGADYNSELVIGNQNISIGRYFSNSVGASNPPKVDSTYGWTYLDPLDTSYTLPTTTGIGYKANSLSTDKVTYHCDSVGNVGRWQLIKDTSGSSTKYYLRNTEGGHHVVQVVVNEEGSRVITYLDSGTTGDIVDPTALLYIGGRAISAGTMTQKDNTLFLGDVELLGEPQDFNAIKSLVQEELKESNDTSKVKYTTKVGAPLPYLSGSYPYSPQLNSPSTRITSFKYGEYYRFGVQLQKSTGEWSEPIWVGDKQNNSVTINLGRTLPTNNQVSLVQASGTISSEVVKQLRSEGYLRIRPLIVYPESYERQVICQGVLNPTVYNIADRANNSPYAQSSWFFRPYSPTAVADGGGGSSSVGSSGISSSDYLGLVLEKKVSVGTTTYLNFYINGSCSPSGYTRREITSIGHRVVVINDKTCYFTVFACNDVSSAANDISRAVSATNFSAVHVGNSEYMGGVPSWGGSYSYNVVGAYGSFSLTSAVTASTSGVLVVDNRVSDTPENMTATYIEKAIGSSGRITETIPVANIGSSTGGSSSEDGSTLTNLGEILEFRHGWSLPAANSRRAEIQCNMRHYESPTSNDLLDKDSDVFFIDQSILTLHSPDLEFDTGLWNLQGSDFKLKIIGYVPITATVGDLDIQTSTPPMNYRRNNEASTAPGFYKEGVGVTNVSKAGFRGLVTTNAWLDELYPDTPKWDDGKEIGPYGFPVYPWHRNGSMNNQNYDKEGSDGYRYSRLKKKKMSNLRFSTQSIYFSSDLEDLDLSEISIFSSSEQTNLRISNPFDDKINYYGNIDKLITHLEPYYISSGSIEEGTTTEAVETATGYRLYRTNLRNASNKHKLFSSSTYYTVESGYLSGNQLKIKDGISSDAIHMKYKSSPHGVISLKAPSKNTLKILPSGGVNNSDTSSITPVWTETAYSIAQNTTSKSMEYGWLWLVDLVRSSDSVVNRFGGTTNEALQSNRWLVGGSTEDLNDSAVTVYWTEGDTYYQRYDCLKTYPFTLEDTNSVVDILSFMCETRVNLDGRYDRNRGQVNNLTMLPSNFNLLNPAYTQRNNFFNYRILDSDLFNFDKYPQTVTWTKTKSNGEKVDTWTNITLASTLDFDGDKGKITKLARLGDSIIAFQEKATSQIMYNEQLQLSTAEGVPVEISNSGKVTGKKYISDSIGCYNKWSVVTTPGGIYFTDSFSNSIQMLSENGLTNLSSSKGMSTWAKSNVTMDVWNPKQFSGIVSYYDYANRDVLFISKNDCLAFSEALGNFTSFYSYGNVPYFINIDDCGIWLTHDYWNKIGRPIGEDYATDLLSYQIKAGSLGTTLLTAKVATPTYNKLLVSTGIVQAPSVSIVAPVSYSVNNSALESLQTESNLITNSLVSSLVLDPSIVYFNTHCKLHFHQKGDYNYFFGKYKPFSTTILASPEYTQDKVFSTIDFRSDTWDSDGNPEPLKTFDTLEVWNEYQHGKETLVDSIDKPSTLKKKFRVWRAQIPRNNFKDSYTGEAIAGRVGRVSRDRMRNTWLYLKLSKDTANTDKTILHDVAVNYFI